MKKLQILFFLFIISFPAYCQITEIEKVDTLILKGQVLYIDKLAKPYYKGYHYVYIPYQLLLFEVSSKTDAENLNRSKILVMDIFDSIESIYDNKIVIRANNTDNFKIRRNTTIKIKRTQYKYPVIIDSTLSLEQYSLDSMLRYIDKEKLAEEISEKDYHYHLKEKLYFRYEIIEEEKKKKF